MPDFDVDKFMAERRKPAGGTQPAAKGFDVDGFMRERQAKPQPAQPKQTAESLFFRHDIAQKAENERQAKREAEFNRKSYLERQAIRAHESFARGGGHVSKMARQALGAGLGAVGAVQGKPFEVVDFPSWRQGEEARFRELDRRRQGRPSSFLTDVGEGIIEAVPTAAGALGLGMLTGGGAPAAIGTGAAMGAAGADWRDPKRAALETVVGGAAPYLGGKVGTAIGGRVASRLARPVAQRTARIGGELAGGGAGNVAGAVAMGERDPRALVRSGIVGSALSAPGAVAAGRRPAITARQTVRDTQEMPIIEGAPATGRLPGVLSTPEYSAGLETAPTAGLPQANEFAPSFALEPAPAKDFEVRLAREGRRAPDRVGPRTFIELGFKTPSTPGQQPRTPILETLSALRKAGLLTGVKTHLRNVGGNLAFQPGEELSRLPASVIDLALSVATKRRTITGPSPVAMAQSAGRAATEGIREAGQIMRRGASQKQMQALQLDQEIRSGNRAVDMYVNGVFRTLAAEDAIFRKFAFTRAVKDRAKAQALTEARQGKISRADIRSRAKQLETDPTIEADAMLDAEVATFNNENLLSQGLSAMREKFKGSRAGRVANFATDLVAPFTRTPTNIIARMLSYSPLGYGRNVYQIADAMAKRAFTAEQQRAFSQTFGRATTGTALILLGYKLGEAGLMTGLFEDEPGKRARDFAAGRTPGAILIGDAWHQVSAFAPFGTLLAVGASLAREAGQERKDESRTFEKVAGVATQAVAQQPLLIGAKEIGGALTQPGTAPEKAGKLAGSFVPTIVSDVGGLTDRVRREGKGFAGKVQQRIPGLRNRLPEATDALGRKIEDRKTAFFDPTLTSTAKDKTDPLMRELVRLDMGISAPTKRRDESEADHRDRKRRAGELFERHGRRLVESPQFKSATKERQRALIERLADRAREASEEGAPETWPLSPAGLVEAVIASEFRRKANAARLKK